MYFYFLMINQNLSVCQSQNYNQDTELTTLCNVNKAVPCFCLPWYTGKKNFFKQISSLLIRFEYKYTVYNVCHIHLRYKHRILKL